MRELFRRIAAAHRAAAASVEGDAALEYAMVAAGVAMAVGYGLFITGGAIDSKLKFAESAIAGADPAVVAEASGHDDIVTGSIGGHGGRQAMARMEAPRDVPKLAPAEGTQTVAAGKGDLGALIEGGIVGTIEPGH